MTMRGNGTPRLPRFADRRKAPARGCMAAVLEVLHKLLTAGAALAALVKALW